MLFFSVQRYLVVGGTEKMTEVVEFIPSNSIPFYGQLPNMRIGAVGAMLGNAPIICGGKEKGYYFDSCLTFANSQWSQSHSMNEKRYFPAVVKINSTTFWILGGKYKSSLNNSHVFLDSTEFISEGQTNGVPGPKLPYAMSRMCAVKVSEEEIFLIGGWNGSSARNEVWIFNPQNGFESKPGPSLNLKRYYHSCSTMRHGGKTVIVVAGGYGLDSFEIYDPIENNWHLGKEITKYFNSIFRFKSNQNSQQPESFLFLL